MENLLILETWSISLEEKDLLVTQFFPYCNHIPLIKAHSLPVEILFKYYSYKLSTYKLSYIRIKLGSREKTSQNFTDGIH